MKCTRNVRNTIKMVKVRSHLCRSQPIFIKPSLWPVVLRWSIKVENKLAWTSSLLVNWRIPLSNWKCKGKLIVSLESDLGVWTFYHCYPKQQLVQIIRSYKSTLAFCLEEFFSGENYLIRLLDRTVWAGATWFSWLQFLHFSGNAYSKHRAALSIARSR